MTYKKNKIKLEKELEIKDRKITDLSKQITRTKAEDYIICFISNNV